MGILVDAMIKEAIEKRDANAARLAEMARELVRTKMPEAYALLPELTEDARPDIDECWHRPQGTVYYRFPKSRYALMVSVNTFASRGREVQYSDGMSEASIARELARELLKSEREQDGADAESAT